MQKTDQIEFKLKLDEMKKENNKKRSKEQKKLLWIILKCFTKQETRLLNFFMIIPQ